MNESDQTDGALISEDLLDTALFLNVVYSGDPNKRGFWVIFQMLICVKVAWWGLGG